MLFQHFDGINSMSHEIALPLPSRFSKSSATQNFQSKISGILKLFHQVAICSWLLLILSLNDVNVCALAY